MAVKTQRCNADVGSQELRLVRDQVNLLVTWVDALKTGVAGAAAYADFQTLVAGLDTSGLRLIVATPKGIPVGPKPAAV